MAARVDRRGPDAAGPREPRRLLGPPSGSPHAPV